jgi:hypothetical protein
MAEADICVTLSDNDKDYKAFFRYYLVVWQKMLNFAAKKQTAVE